MAPQPEIIAIYVPSFPPPPPPPPQKGEDSNYSHKSEWDKKPMGTQSSTTTDYNSIPVFSPTPQPELSSSTLNSVAAVTSNYDPRSSGGWRESHGEYAEHHAMSSAAMGAAGAIATLVFLCLVGGLVFCLCRKSRKNRNSQHDGIAGQEMIKTNEEPDTRAYIRPPSTTPPASIITSPSASVPPPHHEEPPQLLSTTIDQSYYTGIDTSDMVSVADHQRNSATDGGYAASITEPPPPYRPRSIPPFSRDSSMRIPSGRPPSYGPRLSIRSQREVIRSPFEDPEEDSPISETHEDAHSNTTRARDMEEMSDVSELSYQEEPVVARSSLN